MVEVVTYESFPDVVRYLRIQKNLGVDTETTGKSFSDRLFSLAIATIDRSFYFNFYAEEDHMGRKAPVVLHKCMLDALPWEGRYFAHNAKFDMLMLMKETIIPTFECTMINERLLRNDYMNMSEYSLAKTAARYGLAKDMTIDAYIKEHKLYRRELFEGTEMDKVPEFYKVPFKLLTSYACLDARLALEIGLKQDEKFAATARD